MADAIRKQRQSTRSMFTRTVNEIKALFDEDPVNLEMIELKFRRISQLHEKLKQFDGQLLEQLITDEVSEEKYNH